MSRFKADCLGCRDVFEISADTEAALSALSAWYRKHDLCERSQETPDGEAVPDAR